METIPDHQLTNEIAHNYWQYKREPQDRDRRGRLVDPLARMFEQRMNNALQQHLDFARFIDKVVAAEMGDEAAV